MNRNKWEPDPSLSSRLPSKIIYTIYKNWQKKRNISFMQTSGSK
jgi:hypothetical protein